MGAYDCDCTENLFARMRERREKMFNQPKSETKSEIIISEDPIYKLQMFKIIQNKYDLRKSDAKKIVEEVFYFIENKCLEWNPTDNEWEIR